MTAIAPSTSKTLWAIDSSHTHAEFGVKHLMISTVKGSFSNVTGEIVIDESDFADSSVTVVIATDSLHTRDEKRDEHLRSADFFDVELYPTIRFASSSIRPIDAERFVVVGDLTIGKTTREMEIAARRTGRSISPWGATVIGFEGDATIRRKDFGLTWNVALEAGGFAVGDEVKIHLEVEAIRQ